MRSWVVNVLRQVKQQAETVCKEAIRRNGYRFAPIASPKTKLIRIAFSPTRTCIPPAAQFTATRIDSPRDSQFTVTRIDALPNSPFAMAGIDTLSTPPLLLGQIVAPFDHSGFLPLVVTGNLIESALSVSHNGVTSDEAIVSSDYIIANYGATSTLALELLPSTFVGPNIATQHLVAIPGITQIEFALPRVEVRQIAFYEIALPSIRTLPLSTATKVSRNLYQPFRAVQIIGRRFEEKAENRVADEPSTPATGITSNNRRPGEERQPSAPVQHLIWDYLLAFLKPPLRLDRLRPSDLPGTLYPFQIEGVKRLISNTAFLLADEMGTGKTVMTSVALRLLLQQGRIHRVLVICPKSILSVWRRHLRDWAKPLSVVVISKGKAARQMAWKAPAHVYVTTYDAVRNDCTNGFSLKYSPNHPAAQAGGFDAIVLDEAQAVRNPASGRSKAVKAISEETTYNWALTGTPIHNSLNDLTTLCRILRVPPPVTVQGYDSATIWAYFATKPSRHKELIRKAIEPHLLRRRKQDVFPELPSKLRTDEWLELDPDQRVEYEAALAGGRQEFSSGQKEFSRIHVFALINRLKRICNFAKGKDRSPKTIAALEHIEDIVDSGKKVLVFTQYKEEGVYKLKRLLDPFGVEVITGDSSERQRLDAVERFQADPTRHVFLATPKTAGEGLTLTAASYVIHFDQWWNPAVAWQAEDRAHRKGQTEPVNVYSFWMRGTVEGRIHTILKKKGLLHNEIIDSLSETDFDKALTLDDLLSVLDLERDAVRIR